jgi:tetratricopeptide (TPR) repeat protein
LKTNKNTEFMKRVLIVLFLIISHFAVEAQVRIPETSPKAVIKQVVGLTDVEILYSRPSARGRSVLGNLVPFGQLWRTGANDNSTISFSDDVVINGKTLKKGKYALYTIPNIQSWEVLFYTATDNWGTPKEFDDAKVALKTTVNEEALAKPVETFTLAISNLDTSSATLDISWENSFVSLKFEVPTKKLAIASIEKTLAGPTPEEFYTAAQYYYQSNSDIEKGRAYIDKAIELSKNVPFYYLRLKSLIQAKQGDKQGAIETAKLSSLAAEAAGNKEYVEMNKTSIEEWSK